MDPYTYTCASRRFEVVVDASPEEAAQILAEEPDPRVVALVRELLAADAADDAGLLDGQTPGLVAALAEDVVQEPPLHAGDRLGPFRVVRPHRSGGMGTVHLARQDTPSRRVALKVLHPWQRREAIRERFRFESQALSQLHDPMIPQVFAADMDADRPRIAMEWVEGEPLLDWTSTQVRSVSARLELMVAVCASMGRVHAAGVVHRDLKPDNLLVTEAGQPRIVDFGVSVRADAPDAERAMSVGTPSWASPEQHRGEPATPASDVWALAILCWQVLTGRHPFDEAPPGPTGPGRSHSRRWRGR